MKIYISLSAFPFEECDKKIKLMEKDGWKLHSRPKYKYSRDEITMSKDFKKKVKKLKVVKPILNDPYLDLITSKLNK